jgi:hypothetical protein
MTGTRLRFVVVGGLCALALIAAALTSCGDDVAEVPPPDPVSLDQLIEACIVTSACGVKKWPKVSNCVDAYYDLAKPQAITLTYDKVYQCVRAAEGNCTDVFTCYGSNRYAGSCDTTYTATCDSDQAFSCDAIARKVFIYDCAVAKLSCQTKKTSSVDAYCSRGTCTPGKYKTACEGDTVLSCVDGVIQVDDCTARGLYCGTHEVTGALGCLGNQKKKYCGLDPTKPPFQPSCNGNTAVTCENYQKHNEDCSKRDYKKVCKIGMCTYAGSECTESDFNRCKGEQLQYCKEGKWQTLSCASMNLGACKQAVHGANCSAKNW